MDKINGACLFEKACPVCVTMKGYNRITVLDYDWNSAALYLIVETTSSQEFPQ